MPELPEVETLIHLLHKGEYGSILNRSICSVELLWMRSLEEPQPEEFLERIRNKRIVDISRRGKFLVFHLGDQNLLIHLRMSGDIRIADENQPNQKHDRMILHLDIPQKIVFSDARKFGRIWLVKDVNRVLGKLGPEPFDEQLTGSIFYDRLHQRKVRIKALLLDQTFLAGLGNIYTDESLFRARLNPCCIANQLTRNQAADLLKAIREVLDDGIQNNGASIDWVYKGGGYQDRFLVYRRTGKPCRVCQTPIERTVVNQRGTHYCPSCQRI